MSRPVILIVDDEERVLFVLRHALSKLENGFEVLTASTTKDALTKASDHAPDLLITDVIMPGMSGIELTRRITSRGGSPTVIWMTAYGCHSFRAQAEKLGVYRCVNKPLEIAQIRAVAREALAARVGSDEVDSL